MNKRIFISIFLPVLTILLPLLSHGDHISNDKDRWKPFYNDISPHEKVTEWKVPFKTSNRSDVRTISVVSVFGADRMSYVRGHFHTGLDMIPRKRNNGYIDVYAMAPGVVCSIHLGAPHTTVVAKHKLENGDTMFTSYKHLGEIYVETGAQLTSETRVGRLYTYKEAQKLGGNYHHLHLEVRKKFDDYGVASWATMNKSDLALRFHDPLKFMKTFVGK